MRQTDGDDLANDPITDDAYINVGLTKREYFAALALTSTDCPHNSHEHGIRAAWAVSEADALIKALNKTLHFK